MQRHQTQSYLDLFFVRRLGFLAALMLIGASACSNSQVPLSASSGEARGGEQTENYKVHPLGQGKSFSVSAADAPCPGAPSGSPACSTASGYGMSGSGSSASSGTSSSGSSGGSVVNTPSVVNLQPSGAPTCVTPSICEEVLDETCRVPYTANYSCQNFAYNFYNRCKCAGASVVRMTIQCQGGAHAINGVYMPPKPPDTVAKLCAVEPQAPYGPGEKARVYQCTVKQVKQWDAKTRKYVWKPIRTCAWVDGPEWKVRPNPDCNFTYESLCRNAGMKPIPSPGIGGLTIMPDNPEPTLIPQWCSDTRVPFTLAGCMTCCATMWPRSTLLGDEWRDACSAACRSRTNP